MGRRAFLALGAFTALAGQARGARAEPSYPVVRAGERLRFPRDHGAHPAFRNEWWYITGWLSGGRGQELGFQVTFFRNRPGIGEASASRFAPSQLLFAHAALCDATLGRLEHDQRSARAGFGLAQASREDTEVRIEDWSLARGEAGYTAKIPAREFTLSLQFAPQQPLLAQGEEGYSRKGPLPEQASHYYSWPQLRASGSVTQGARARSVSGVAWLDHEWSSEPLAREAQGWDWAGINGADGSALMAFRIRGRDARRFWAGGSLREAGGRVRVLEPGEVDFRPLRWWRSPRTGTAYPVAMAIEVPGRELTLAPLMDDQELDARASTGTLYWEGAVRAAGAGAPYGKGYLELTGYAQRMKL
ncbi:MAG: carotenoid 1,2-hydratase [Burkholderiales bacterium]|nr:carotenoid 1,2-hydratase [Burkholderiales bacterium]